MGIRIKKTLGYGVIVEPKLQETIYDLADKDLDKYSIENYRKFLENKYGDRDSWTTLHTMDILTNHHKNQPEYKKPKSVIDLFNFNEIDGDTYFTLVPYGQYIEWSRYDDSIDYYEALFQDKDISASVKHIDIALYPYSGRMVATTGESIIDSDKPEHTLLKLFLGLSEEDYNQIGITENSEEQLGFQGYKDMKAKYPPIVPNEVRDVIEFSGFFEEENFALTLRPMLITTWS
jgi:hypothetical protein